MQKPAIVTSSVRLQYLTLIIGVMRVLLEQSWSYPPSDPRLSPAVVLFVRVSTIIFTFGLLLWLIRKTDRGRHWARVTLLVLFVVGIPLSIQPMLASFSHSVVSGLLGLLQGALQLVALVMIFSPQARPWFRPSAESPTASDRTA